MGRVFEQVTVGMAHGQVNTRGRLIELGTECTALVIYNRSATTIYANDYPVLPTEVATIEALDGRIDLRALAGTADFDFAFGNMKETPDCS